MGWGAGSFEGLVAEQGLLMSCGIVVESSKQLCAQLCNLGRAFAPSSMFSFRP